MALQNHIVMKMQRHDNLIQNHRLGVYNNPMSGYCWIFRGLTKQANANNAKTR